MKYALLTLCCLALLGATAFADDKFTAMDTNNDGAVSPAEFTAAYPQMNEAAFAAIDTDKNNALSHEEWHAFIERHQQGKMQSGMGGMGGMGRQMPPQSAGQGMPLITPPAK